MNMEYVKVPLRAVVATLYAITCVPIVIMYAAGLLCDYLGTVLIRFSYGFLTLAGYFFSRLCIVMGLEKNE